MKIGRFIQIHYKDYKIYAFYTTEKGKCSGFGSVLGLDPYVFYDGTPKSRITEIDITFIDFIDMLKIIGCSRYVSDLSEKYNKLKIE